MVWWRTVYHPLISCFRKGRGQSQRAQEISVPGIANVTLPSQTDDAIIFLILRFMFEILYISRICRCAGIYIIGRCWYLYNRKISMLHDVYIQYGKRDTAKWGQELQFVDHVLCPVPTHCSVLLQNCWMFVTGQAYTQLLISNNILTSII